MYVTFDWHVSFDWLCMFDWHVSSGLYRYVRLTGMFSVKYNRYVYMCMCSVVWCVVWSVV